MRKKAGCFLLLCILTCICFTKKTSAQDPHFSQYFSSPLTFNPAFTGYFDGSSRFSFNFRNQWSNTGDPYTTGTASYDVRILKNKIGNNDRWGLGVYGLYDQSTGGIYKNTYFSLSTGFNKGLDETGDQSIGIGLQATFGTNSVDFARIAFNNQFDGVSGFNLSIPSGETVNNRSVSYMDVNAGILYNYKDETGNQFSLGAAMFHLLKPKLSFFSNSNPTLAQRFTVHASAGLLLNEKDDLFISAHGMMQGGSNEYVLGAAYGLGLGSGEMSLYLGAWLRLGAATYPYIGIRTPDYQIGLSYDLLKADINRINRFTGSSELSFIYYFNNEKRGKGIPCFF